MANFFGIFKELKRNNYKNHTQKNTVAAKNRDENKNWAASKYNSKERNNFYRCVDLNYTEVQKCSYMYNGNSQRTIKKQIFIL